MSESASEYFLHNASLDVREELLEVNLSLDTRGPAALARDGRWARCAALEGVVGAEADHDLDVPREGQRLRRELLDLLHGHLQAAERKPSERLADARLVVHDLVLHRVLQRRLLVLQLLLLSSSSSLFWSVRGEKKRRRKNKIK